MIILYRVKNDNIISQFNELKNKMIRIENDNSILIKENQDLKNELINKKHEINPNEDINLLKNELSYKNSIIKYLEELLCCSKKDGEIPQGLGEDLSLDEYEKNINKMKISSEIDFNKIKNSINNNEKNKEKIKEKELMIDHKEKKNNNNIGVNNNQKKLKLNEDLYINNNTTESNEDFVNKDIDLEYSNDNMNKMNNIYNHKDNKQENDFNINKKNKSLAKSEKIKNEIEELDVEILEIQTKLKEMLQK